jgi:polysaccharide deacetylase family protein (PEP-CTERM system associated)
MSLTHGLSLDVECYYQIAWKDYLGQHRPPTNEVVTTTNWLLDEMADAGVTGTLFFLGNVARTFPGLVQRAADEGHELGVHGDQHHYVYDLTPSTFREDLRVAIDAIEQAGGQKVLGHRAAAFSIGRDTWWALDVIAALGLRYDSSIFPIQGRRYGVPDSPLGVHRMENGLWEIPLTVVVRRRRRFPAAGGGYFRTFPYRYTRWALGAVAADGRPGITYFHPHEFSLQRPKIDAATALSHPRGAARMAKLNVSQSVGRGAPMRRKFARMIREFPFAPLRSLLPESATR